ncbi:Na antiporter subunit B protein [Halorhabdus tiamatea SARL4B]|uniref:Na antiporter subunit B protein n=1 Tax=Halorhabdus tiamatea SARL4B TaxID=1033806 RepID=F7PLA1_9EURY|nr:MnhB domain-containing protein [Halorhabdus tiamatea]ERJ05192.1 Na antiporter subunit B protein [Halorhabdus tiamatea SARL4B]CCQ34739.1 Na(+):H(+) antiporter, subunit B [Halorhabdus tiamatea SARL4B]
MSGESPTAGDGETTATPQVTDGDTTVIARTVVRIVVPIILLVAIALLLQGHNQPGGGFIAGVLTTSGIALVYIIYGLHYVEENLLSGSVLPRSFPLDVDNTGAESPASITKEFGEVFGIGLAIAAGGGLAALVFGYPFLSQAVVFLEHLPIYGEVEIASALVFDLGVYVVVVGGLLTILAVVGNE